jgi:hypothetical protein
MVLPSCIEPYPASTKAMVLRLSDADNIGGVPIFKAYCDFSITPVVQTAQQGAIH